MDDSRDADWVDLGPIDDLEEGAPTLRKAGGQRFVCVRQGAAVHALDDRCPHQGYPLSQGRVDGCVLTCEWHNWKFDLASGACVFGGEPVRAYPTRVVDGRVRLDRHVDHAQEAGRLEAGLRAALVDDDPARALREGLRLGQHRGGAPALAPLGAAFEVLAADGAARAEWGLDHGLAMLADVIAWVERGWLPAAEAFVLAATCVAEPSRHLGRRMAAPPAVGAGPDHAGLVAFVAGGLHDYGHGAIFLAKAEELARRFPAAAAEVMTAMAVTLGWATNEVALPPFTATRKALAAVEEVTPGAERALVAGEDAAQVEALLAGEKEALAATLALLADGVPGRALLRVAARAAARRIARFDDAWERRIDAEVSVLDVTHALTFVEAALVLSTGAPEAIGRRLAVVAAGFIGKLRRGDAAGAIDVSEETGTIEDLVEAAAARDVVRARRLGRGLAAAERRAAYRGLAPFLAFDMAVRPIFAAHGVKLGEALHRLELSDPDGGGVYLDALLAFAVPRRPERRVRRIAHVAQQFLEDGRPPEGLY